MSDMFGMVSRLNLRQPVCISAAGAALALFTAASPLQAQVSGCDVIGPAANVVCSDLQLTQLSDQLNSAVRGLLGSTERAARRQLIREHRDWSLANRNCLADTDAVECLRQAYEARISDLASRLDGAIETAETDGAGEIPVEGSELPPLTGPAEAGAEAEAETDELSAAAEIAAAAAAAGAGDEEAGSEVRTPARTETDEDLGGFRGEAAASPAPSFDDSEIGAILTANVWKADIATGVRPGTIFVFQKDGALVTADCVESYKLGDWALDGEAKLTLNDGGGSKRNATIISARDRFVRLQIDGSAERRDTLVLRPASAPFSCKS